MTEVYVSKVTAAGQISLPKELRLAMGIGEDYLVIEPFGDAKAKGMTREQLEKAIKRSGKKILRDAYNVE